MIRIRFRPAFSRFGMRLWGALVLALPMLHGPVGLAADDALPHGISDALQARAVGPALIGGRIMAITGIPGEPDTLFVGGATSGVWKTEDAGITWTPIADDIDTSSIGAIAVDPTDPDVIWLGTGEPKPRYGTGLGTGVRRAPGTELRRLMDFDQPRRYGLMIASGFQDLGPEPVVIAELEWDTRHVRETCRAREIDWSFENDYWIDRQHGLVWKSVQHFHPDMPPVVMELLKPPSR